MKSFFKSLTICASFSLLSPTLAKDYPFIPAENFLIPEGLEVKVWATSPLFFNPTNMDVDYKGRVWVAEGQAYRAFRNKFNKNKVSSGDRIMVLSDTDGDGTADQSEVFVQDPELIAPLGVAVIGNKVVVSQPPSLIIYHDENGDTKFDPAVDKKEKILTGFGGNDHDHSLHAVTAGPSGQWYFNTGNAGTHIVKDKDGFTIKLASSYKGGSPSVTEPGPNQGGKSGLVSDDGHIYVGSAIFRMNPDGTGLRVIGHNMRNSYEETVTSFGDVFQNDNDDPPACRTTWVMEYGNLGFASDDGSKSWKAERRPGQHASVAEWRQEDPGKIPAGDVYGNGSPTGIAYLENGSLGEKWNGLLLSCEAARNVVFGYYPERQGAGYALKRFNFLKSDGKSTPANGTNANDFRPSDVTVGPDGAIYVADWYDPGVGGHRMQDKDYAGAIYRITIKGDNPKTPEINLDTTEGQLAALKSPAVNVRNAGFTRLKAGGEASLDSVRSLLKEDSDYLKARGIWLLAQLGEEGQKEVLKILRNSENTDLRITAFRALRLIDYKVLDLITEFTKDNSIALRRELLLALRDMSWEKAQPSLYELAIQYDGNDRWYLEAVGTAATGKEAQLYDKLVKEFDPAAPEKWSQPMAMLAWRLHPDSSLDALKARALSADLSKPVRKDVLTAIGYIPTKEAALAMVNIAKKGPEDLRSLAQWWLHNHSNGKWKNFKNKMEGLDKEPNALPKNQDYLIPIDEPENTKPTVKEVTTLTGNAEKGKVTIARCYMCHKINDAGIEFGPDLTTWGAGRSIEAIATAIINPSEGIAHGYEGTEILTKKGHKVQGLILSSGLLHVVRVMGGGELSFQGKELKSRKVMEKSLMLSAGQLGLESQDVADIAAYLRALAQEKTASQ